MLHIPSFVPPCWMNMKHTDLEHLDVDLVDFVLGNKGRM